VVRSAPGEGARFEIYFPRHRGSSSEAGVRARGGRGGSERVLIVENESGVRSVAARALSSRGYAVVEAAGGSEALGGALDDVALAVVDVVMPGMDGWELARELRRRRPGQRVLFISGYVPGQDGTFDRADGPSSFLAKPFTPEQLASRVREMLDA
jgi:CheY-like chemotaxis protein